MTYVVVGVDGTMHTRKHQPIPIVTQLEYETRGQSLAHVRLRHLPTDRSTMCVYTVAHNPAIVWKRNPIGAAVAATFGAEQYPYAGPIMFVGWTDPTIVHSLPRAMRTAVAEVHASVTLALAGAQTAFGPVWAQAIRDYTRRVVEVAGPEWLDLPPIDLFGRDVTGRSWWLCPTGSCGHAEMFHKDGCCWFNTCECGKGPTDV